MTQPEDQKSKLMNIMLISGLVMGGFLVYEQFFAPPAPETTETTADPGTEEPVEVEPEVDPATRLQAQQIFTIETEDFRAQLTNLNTGIRSLNLFRERYENEDGSPMQVVTTSDEEYLPARPEFGGIRVPADTVWQGEQVSPTEVRFQTTADGFTLERKIEAGAGPYQLWITTDIINDGPSPRTVRLSERVSHYVSKEAESGGMFTTQSPELSHGLCYWGDEEVSRLNGETALVQDNPLGHGLGPDVLFAGVENSFFVNVLAPSSHVAERCQIRSTYRGGTIEDPEGTLFETRLMYPQTEVAGREEVRFRTLAYLGPKDSDALLAAGHHLPQTVDLGWFSAVAGWFVTALRYFYDFVGNWGLAIILMTICLRIVLLPLTWKSFKMMGEMRVQMAKLKPEMDAINEKYKGNSQARGEAVMALYKQHGMNPFSQFGGCLPQLLQMPIFFAFYASLSTNVELYHAEFALWWTDLSSPDPYYSLPILLGLLMHFQQRLMTTAAIDPKQQKIMMYMMPIMIMSFMLFLPSGLCLYMVTNSVLGIAQQQIIYRKIGADKAGTAGGTDPEGSPDEPEDSSDHAPNAEPVAALATGGRNSSSSVVSRTKAKKKKAKRRSRRA